MADRPMKQILIVDDEPSILTLLKYNLEKERYQVDTANDGREALQKATTKAYDFIVLDLMLPYLDGTEVTKELRSQKITTPIIILTAKDEVFDKVVALEMGADDYLTKPFSPRELIARMKATYRRYIKQEHQEISQTLEVGKDNILQVGALTLYPDEFIAEKNGKPLTLTRKEFELLTYFMKRKNRIIDRERMLVALWNDSYVGQSRIVDIQVSHLREKIEDNPKEPKYLLTIRGFGYKFQEPENEK